MHRVQALVWTQQSAWQELKQLFSNETNIPWQLMMENTEPNWGNAALCNVEIYLQAVRAPLRKHNFVVNVWKITTSPGFKDELSHTVSSQYLQGKWCFENYSIIVFVCFFEIIDKKRNLVQLKNLRSRPHYLNQKRKKENKDYAIFFSLSHWTVCVACLTCALVRLMWQVVLEGKAEAKGRNRAHSQRLYRYNKSPVCLSTVQGSRNL